MTGKVVDRFEMKGRTALEYGAEGLVIIFQHDPAAAAPSAGERVLLVRDDGWMYSGTAEDIRSEPSASASGLFLRHLKLSDVPVGATLCWGSEVESVRRVVA